MKTKVERDLLLDPVYQAIVKFWKEHNYSPSLRELRDMVGYGSTNTVNYHLVELVQDGLITISKGEARTIVVVGSHWIEPVHIREFSKEEKLAWLDQYENSFLIAR